MSLPMNRSYLEYRVYMRFYIRKTLKYTVKGTRGVFAFRFCTAVHWPGMTVQGRRARGRPARHVPDTVVSSVLLDL